MCKPQQNLKKHHNIALNAYSNICVE